MRAITIKAPWAWAIMHGGKDIENRTWKTNVRGRIAVHSSPGLTREDYEWARRWSKQKTGILLPDFEELERAAIIGTVEVIDCVKRHPSRWHARGHYGFVLANPRPLSKPVPCAGFLGFWEVPEDVRRLVTRRSR
jgi:hypothetical protein